MTWIEKRFFTGMIIFFLGSIGNAFGAETVDRIPIFVSLEPQAYFVEQIGGVHVQVGILVSAGQNPHTFEPSPRQLNALSKARLYFQAGLQFEDRLLAKIRDMSLKLAVIDLQPGVTEVSFKDPHDAGSENAHAHEGAEHHDPHSWLSPPMIKIQAALIRTTLSTADPVHASDYERNYEHFVQEIDRVHKKIQTVLGPYRGRSFYVFHPAYGHFAQTYGLKQQAVEFEGKSPTPKSLNKFLQQAKSEQVTIIFVQPQYDIQQAATIADVLQARIVALDPLAKDVLSNLERMALEVRRALQ